MKKMMMTLSLLTSLLLAGVAQATLVTQWKFDQSSTWNSATFSVGGGSTLQNASVISWGGTLDFHNNTGNGTSSRSGLEITNGNILGGTVVTNGPAAVTNTITHYNNTLSGAYATLTNAVLDTLLTLTPDLPIPGAALPPDLISFAIHFKETPNQANCGFITTSLCDDIFVIDSGALNNSFVYDGFTYYVSAFETTNKLQPLPAATCAVAGAAAGCLGFQTEEGKFTPATFAFVITSTPVQIPEPGLLALIGIGLLGLFLSRKQSS